MHRTSCRQPNDKSTSRSGLILIAEVMRRMNVDNLANRHFPVAGSNRGFSVATYIQVFVLMLLEGGRCLEDIRHLKAESDLLSMLGMKRLPGADALSNWLRRMGRSKAGLRGYRMPGRIRTSRTGMCTGRLPPIGTP